VRKRGEDTCFVKEEEEFRAGGTLLETQVAAGGSGGEPICVRESRGGDSHAPINRVKQEERTPEYRRGNLAAGRVCDTPVWGDNAKSGGIQVGGNKEWAAPKLCCASRGEKKRCVF